MKRTPSSIGQPLSRRIAGRRRLLGLALILVAVLAFLPAHRPALAASDLDADIPVRFSADEVQYDQEGEMVLARGNVEVIRAGRILKSDSISYNQRTDMLTASGNIVLLEPTGEVIFGEHMELSGDLKNGIISDIRIILSDGARIAANGARLTGGNTTEMRKAVYSPCASCREDPSRPPLWQLKAVKIVHDKRRQTIEYSDAWLEIAGVPVFYTPYFSHPDPTVKRRSGFLTPSIGNSSDLGVIMEAPYYYALTPSSDVTLTPIVTTNEGPVLAVDYREVLSSGTVEWKGSVTRDSLDDVRGHFIGKARFDIDDTWRWGLDAERTSDDTYMRRYGFAAGSTLTSHAFAEGFRDRNYFSIDAYSFQSLTSGSAVTPLILPALEYSHIGQPDGFGGRTNLDVNFLALTRAPGRDTRRLSIDAGWQAPYIGPMGDVYRFSASLRGDLYHIDKFERTGGKEDFSGFTGRIIPRASLEWRYPFVRTDGPFSQIIEPLASIVVSPYGGNPDTIPNEDSLTPELDDTNLFKENRFAGFDRIDGGPRINYGLKWGIFGSGIGSTSVMIGQSYRFKSDDTFIDGSGIEDKFSDFVGIVRVKPASLVDLVYRTRFDKDNLEIERNELVLSAGVPAFRVNANYIFFDRQLGSEFSGREEINFSFSSQINRFWRTSARATRDLSTNDMRSIGFGLTYEDECLVFSTDITRSFFEDRDLKPTDAIIFSLSFKTLGDLSTGFSSSQ